HWARTLCWRQDVLWQPHHHAGRRPGHAISDDLGSSAEHCASRTNRRRPRNVRDRLHHPFLQPTHPPHMTAHILIPTVETERLILREHRLSDFDAYAALWRDPVVTRFIGGRARSREESWVRFLRHAGMWHHIGFGFWAIEEKASGSLIGEAGFHDLKR